MNFKKIDIQGEIGCISRMTTNKSKKNNEIRILLFGNHHNNNWFQHEWSKNAKTKGVSLIRKWIFT